MKKLYLHMGLHKTASTSFQETCKINKEKLLEQGFIYPIFNSEYISKKDIANHSIPLYSLFCEDAKNYHVNKKFNVQDIELLHKDYTNILENTLKSDKNVIISGEDISLLNINALQELKSLIEKYDFEIIPFILVRSPYSFLCSIKQARIRQGIAGKDDFFVSKIEVIETIKEVFAKTDFISFKKAIKEDNGLIFYLFNYMNINPANFRYTEANEAMSNALARVLEIINKKIGKWKENKLNPCYFELIDYLEKQRFMNDGKYLLTQEEYLLIEECCDKENIYFRENLGEEFCDKDIVFSKIDARLALFEDYIDKNCTEDMSEKEISFRYKRAINKYFNKIDA